MPSAVRLTDWLWKASAGVKAFTEQNADRFLGLGIHARVVHRSKEDNNRRPGCCRPWGKKLQHSHANFKFECKFDGLPCSQQAG